MAFNKKQIRKFILNQRYSIDPKIKKIWDKEIEEKLILTKQFKDATTIFIYVSFNSEVSTRHIIKLALHKGKRVCVPKVDKSNKIMDAYYINHIKDLKKGVYGILEPKDQCIKACNEDIDLIVCPGLAFDKFGNRIGYGGGYYDKFIGSTKKKIISIGLAYKFQIIDNVYSNEKDKRINYIITNN